MTDVMINVDVVEFVVMFVNDFLTSYVHFILPSAFLGIDCWLPKFKFVTPYSLPRKTFLYFQIITSIHLFLFMISLLRNLVSLTQFNIFFPQFTN